MALSGGEAATTASEGLRLSQKDLQWIAEAVANIIKSSSDPSPERGTGGAFRGIVIVRKHKWTTTVCLNNKKEKNRKKEVATTRRPP